MALLDETNLAAERTRYAKFRTNHVGTKLNEEEFAALDSRARARKLTLSEWVRAELHVKTECPSLA